MARFVPMQVDWRSGAVSSYLVRLPDIEQLVFRWKGASCWNAVQVDGVLCKSARSYLTVRDGTGVASSSVASTCRSDTAATAAGS